jgi:hypothetical protein
MNQTAHEAADQILCAIRSGMVLRIPHDASTPTVVDPPERSVGLPEQIASRLGVDELMKSNVLRKLTRYEDHYVIGWESLGLDGSHSDFWVYIQ